MLYMKNAITAFSFLLLKHAKRHFICNHCKRVNNKFDKSMIYLLTSCNTEERIAQNIYIHNSNRTYKRINYNNNDNINLEMDRLLELCESWALLFIVLITFPFLD